MTGPPKEVGAGARHHSDDRPHDFSSHHATHNRRVNPSGQAAETSVATASQQVSWWSVHEFITAVLDQVNGWPLAGTAAWCSLAHDDPRKWAAVLDAGQHHALRLELNQQAHAAASRSVSAAADWTRVAREVRGRTEFHSAHPWMRRKVERTKRW